MTEKHLHRKKAIVGKEVEVFGDLKKHKLPGNIAFDPADIGEFGKPLKPHHHKAAIKKVHKHVLGLGAIIPQKISHPGKVPRNIGLYGAKEGSPEWYKEMDVLVKRYTGWDSLKHMCANRPTLRVSKGHSNLEASAIYMLRDAYKFVTGRESHPEENWDAHAKNKRR
jgi:hypothetical protein